jgi:RNA polymerase sigma factor (sigma-70 family)
MPDDAATRSLVAEAARGDREAWDALVDAFGGLVWAVIRGVGLYGPDAADVSQTTWLRCVEHLDRLRDPARIGSWLASTARHECYRVLRRRGRAVPVGDPPEVSDLSDRELDHALVAGEDHEALVAALERVPSRCQSLLRLLIADPPLSYDEISDVLDMPKGSIGPTRMRCLDHVRAQMGSA